MQELQVFSNPTFGEVRTITIDGNTLFCGYDVARSLGYCQPHKAIRRHCRYGTKHTVPHPQSSGKTIEMLFIPEGDVYRLSASSELPGAEKFESWIFDEVLPTIRRTGTYSIVAEPSPVPRTTPGELAHLMKEMRILMTLENIPAAQIAEVVRQVVMQWGIVLPPRFVKPNPWAPDQVQLSM